MTTNVFIPDAWRAAQEPDAITEAVRIGEQITTLLVQAATLIERAFQNVDSIIENTNLGCQQILDQLTRETNRLAPVLYRLRAAAKAVRS
jgi:hypothetical protein